MANECEEYVKEKMKIVPRFLKPVCQVNPTAAKRFADFYESIWGERALGEREKGLLARIKSLLAGEVEEAGGLDRKTKELIFTAIGVPSASPRCLVHVIPAIEAGASDDEILEAVSVGFIGAGFYPNNPGIPYAFEYAAKTLEVLEKYRKGEEWEYIEPTEFRG